MGVRDKIKGWFLTYPQCSLEKQAVLTWCQSIDNVVEYVICSELHADGNPHLHAFIRFETGIRRDDFRKFDMPSCHGHYEQCKSNSCVIKYCKKDGDFITNINEDNLLSPQLKRAKFVHDTLKAKSVKQMLEDGDINYQSAKQALFAKQILDTPYRHDKVRGVWIQGKPGVGKTHKARHDYGESIYIKSMNKWWDGYAGEHVVILDDFEKTAGPMLGHYLKIWMDRWECTGEIKGGTINLKHHLFIITSNYTIEECFGHDDELVQAISRRVELINM